MSAGSNAKNGTKLPGKDSESDVCLTPGYALEPLARHIDLSAGPIWEPAAGPGMLAKALRSYGPEVIETTIERGQDFYKYEEPPAEISQIVTNPPYSHKARFAKKALQLCRRVALIMPTETVSTAGYIRIVQIYGEPGIIFFAPRVHFYMPNKGFYGSVAGFPTAWFTWGHFTGVRFELMKWGNEYRSLFDEVRPLLPGFDIHLPPAQPGLFTEGEK